MSADILTDATFPHGTEHGYPRGCKSAQCPGTIPCRDVHIRFHGDYQFRKRINAGETVADILATEAQIAEQARLAEIEAARKRTLARRAAAQRARQAKAPKKRTPGEPRKSRSNSYANAVAEQHKLGKTDKEIAEALGLKKHQVSTSRRWLGLSPNGVIPGVKDQIPALCAQGLTDVEIGRILKRDHRHISYLRKTLGIAPVPRATSRHDVIRMHTEGADTETIAAAVGILPKSVERIIRKAKQETRNAEANA